MNKTKIDWCDSTWNPVTGCLHGCEYCYARRIANRFKGCDIASTYNTYGQATWRRLNPHEENEKALFEVLEECPPVNVRFDKKKQVVTKAPYPFGFKPTLRRDRLEEYVNKKGRTIFVCSMADLFGAWVPDEWINAVFAACREAPQHNYLFLTKDYMKASSFKFERNWWIGRTHTSDSDTALCNGDPWSTDITKKANQFLSIEPILGEVTDLPYYAHEYGYKWVIVGAETGNRKNRVVPKREWIEKIVTDCKFRNVPVFMKSSLANIWGEPLIQEFPKQFIHETGI